VPLDAIPLEGFAIALKASGLFVIATTSMPHEAILLFVAA
jgi:hypothetical protein